MSAASTKPTPSKAWVVFSGKTDLNWLKILKPGFRHCYVLLNDGQKWISYDPLSPHTEIIAHHHIPAEFDLPGWLECRGQRSVPAAMVWNRKKPAPFMLFTCVEAVKRLLGLHRFFIFTPWQLYRHLCSQQFKQGETSWAQ